MDAVEDLESAILSDPRVELSKIPPPLSSVLDGASCLLRRVGLLPPPVVRAGAPASPSGRHHFLVLMGPEMRSIVPQFLPPGRRSVYLFDAWPRSHELARRLISWWGIHDLFVSASQAAAALESTAPGCRVSWVPEAIDANRYRYRPYDAKDTDVIQLGRRHDTYHERIRDALQSTGRSYLYEEVRGRLIFPTRSAFIEGLARSRISVCFPSSITHPDRSGGVETMTQRYLQSIAAKCLVIGHAPAEMVRLFGYDPVLEADMDDPAGQLEAVLSEFDRYLPLIEQNHRTVVERHTWKQRWSSMAESLLNVEPCGRGAP